MNKELEKEKQNKAGNPLFVVIIFIALIGFMFIIPELYQRFNKDIAGFLGIGKNSENENKEPQPEDKIISQSAFYQIGSLPNFKYNELTLNDMHLENGLLSLKLTSEENIDLNSKNYYIEFYQNQSKFLGRRLLKGEVNNELELTLDVSRIDVTTVTYFTLSHITDDSIPNIQIPSDESGLTSISCSLGDNNYTYEFSDKKLLKVKKQYTKNTLDMNTLSGELLEYQKKEKEYNELNGVTASLVSNENSLIFSVEFDYSQIQSFSHFKNEFIFKKDVEDRIVKFKMDAEGYDCQ